MLQNRNNPREGKITGLFEGSAGTTLIQLVYFTELMRIVRRSHIHYCLLWWHWLADTLTLISLSVWLSSQLHHHGDLTTCLAQGFLPADLKSFTKNGALTWCKGEVVFYSISISFLWIIHVICNKNVSKTEHYYVLPLTCCTPQGLHSSITQLTNMMPRKGKLVKLGCSIVECLQQADQTLSSPSLP